jgi:hypothetical protein
MQKESAQSDQTIKRPKSDEIFGYFGKGQNLLKGRVVAD